MRIRSAVPIVLLGWIAFPDPAGAQDREPVLTVQVISSEQLAGLPVSRSAGALREALGMVSSTAPLQLNMNNINFGKGKRVGVNVHGNELVLIEQGTRDQRCEEARQGDRSSWCQEVAVLNWGTSALLGVSSNAGVIQVTTGRPASPPQSRFRIGASVMATNFYRLEDVACDASVIPGLTECDAEASGTAFGASAEYQLSRGLSLGVGYVRMKYGVDQDYGGEPVRHEVNVAAFDLFGRLNLRPGATVRPWGLLGMSYYDNEDDVYWDDAPFGTHGQGGPRILIGAGADLRIAGRVDLRGMLRHGGGAGRDADSQWGVGFGIGYNF